MAWIESHQTLKDHPKLTILAEKLKINKAQAIGHLHMLWWWCISYADDGRLDSYTPTQIAHGADFSENSGEFIQALADSGFLDRDPLRVHDWLYFCGDLVKKRLEYRKYKSRRVKRLRESLRKKEICQPTVTVTNSNHTNTETPLSPGLAFAVLSHFNAICRKALTLTPERQQLIEKRLAGGRTVEEMKRAIENFAKDDWSERPKFMDLVYVIGVRNKIDNLDRWLNFEPRKEPATWMNQ